MDKKLLEDYKLLQNEIDTLADRIEHLKKMEARYEYGAVKGSNPEFPFQPMSFHVSGYNIRDDEKKRKRIKELEYKLQKQKDKAEQDRIEVEEFIAGISDRTTQLAFTYIYLDGMTQEEAGRTIGLDRSRISRKIDDYLKTHTKHKKGVLE